MAISPVIPTGILDDPCNVAPIKRWQTYEPVILYLQYTTTPPTLKPITKRYRGLDTECGFKVYWPPLTCIRQLETAASIYHHFQLPTLTPGTKLYYRVTTDCDLKVKNQFTPPLVYNYPLCPATAGFVKAQRTSNSGSTTPVQCILDQFVAGNPSLYSAGQGGLVLPPNTTWQGYAFGQIQNILGSTTIPTTFEVRITAGGVLIPGALASPQLVRNQTYDFVLNFSGYNTGGLTRIIRLEARRVGTPLANVRFVCTAASPGVLTAIQQA